MLEFEKKIPKEWVVSSGGSSIELNLISSTVTNKYHIVTDFVEKMSKILGEEFDVWFMDLVSEYKGLEEGRFDLLFKNIDTLKKYVDDYVQKAELDFSKFVDESKTKKNSIFFNEIEIQKIIELSGYLKLYSIFSNNIDMKLPHKLHKKIYNEISKEIITDEDVIFKIFNIIKTKTFRYNMTDSYMWEYIKLIQCKSIDVHVIEIFNFIMNSILILCEEDRNPITYFVSVVDESVKWFLRSVYKGSIVYDDSISTEDIHGMNINNLKSYSYNDTLGQLKRISYEKIYQGMEDKPMTFDSQTSDDAITTFQNRMARVEFVSPIVESFVFPVVAQITEIPYSHFKTLSPEHAAVISAYIKDVFEEVFKDKYENVFRLLDYYPTDKPAVATTYKIKSIHNFINLQDEIQNFYGFKTKITAHDIISFFIGRIARVDFRNIYDGSDLAGIPLSKIENEMIDFFTLLFSNQLTEEIDKMKQMVLRDF